MYDIAPGVTWDIFDAGKVYSNVKVQNARQAEALQAYRKAVLQSFQDVDDSLVTLNHEQVRLQALHEAVNAPISARSISPPNFSKRAAPIFSAFSTPSGACSRPRMRWCKVSSRFRPTWWPFTRPLAGAGSNSALAWRN